MKLLQRRTVMLIVICTVIFQCVLLLNSYSQQNNPPLIYETYPSTNSEKQNSLLEDFVDEMIRERATPLPSHIRSVLRDLCRYTPILPIWISPKVTVPSMVVKLTSCLAIGADGTKQILNIYRIGDYIAHVYFPRLKFPADQYQAPVPLGQFNDPFAPKSFIDLFPALSGNIPFTTQTRTDPGSNFVYQHQNNQLYLREGPGSYRLLYSPLHPDFKPIAQISDEILKKYTQLQLPSIPTTVLNLKTGKLDKIVVQHSVDPDEEWLDKAQQAWSRINQRSSRDANEESRRRNEDRKRIANQLRQIGKEWGAQNPQRSENTKAQQVWSRRNQQSSTYSNEDRKRIADQLRQIGAEWGAQNSQRPENTGVRTRNTGSLTHSPNASTRYAGRYTMNGAYYNVYKRRYQTFFVPQTRVESASGGTGTSTTGADANDSTVIWTTNVVEPPETNVSSTRNKGNSSGRKQMGRSINRPHSSFNNRGGSDTSARNSTDDGDEYGNSDLDSDISVDGGTHRVKGHYGYIGPEGTYTVGPDGRVEE